MIENREQQIKSASEIIAYGCSDELRAALIQDFPELAESKEERIRMELMDFISSSDISQMLDEEKQTKWFAWLEKQKERGPITKEEEYTLNRIIEYLEDESCPLEWRDLLGDIHNLPYTQQKEQKSIEWSAEDEKMINAIIIGYQDRDFRNSQIPTQIGVSKDEVKSWLKSLRPQHNLRWRRATEGANLPESIIMPDGDDPRFGKCAVKDSWYIPISELKELPKE